MELVVAKVLCLLGVFALMLAGILVPVRLMMQVDYDKSQNYRKALALCNSFGGGVFLATCFNALLPAVKNKVGSHVLSNGNHGALSEAWLMCKTHEFRQRSVMKFVLKKMSRKAYFIIQCF
jgi:hypothetical protein